MYFSASIILFCIQNRKSNDQIIALFLFFFDNKIKASKYLIISNFYNLLRKFLKQLSNINLKKNEPNETFLN